MTMTSRMPKTEPIDLARAAPFQGRRPIYAGDDVTDEAAFAAARERGGIAIKLGAGTTGARYRAAGPVAFLDWLAALARGGPCRSAKAMAEGAPR